MLDSLDGFERRLERSVDTYHRELREHTQAEDQHFTRLHERNEELSGLVQEMRHQVAVLRDQVSARMTQAPEAAPETKKDEEPDILSVSSRGAFLSPEAAKWVIRIAIGLIMSALGYSGRVVQKDVIEKPQIEASDK